MAKGTPERNDDGGPASPPPPKRAKSHHPPNRAGTKRRRRFDDLFSSLPRSANAMCSNSMVSSLDPGARRRIGEYVRERCPGSPEVAAALLWAADARPTHLRTKELCETLEAVTLVGARISALLAARPAGGRPMTVYDLACGHGLAGVLLAYRFPRARVVCVDRERRPCWATYRDAFERHGERAEGEDAVLPNLEFREGDMKTDVRPERGDYLVCIHGCNDLSPHTVAAAVRHRTGFAVMPCCIRDGVLGVSSASSGRNWGIQDDKARYALQVGYLAGKFACSKVVAISHVITNRFLIITGDRTNDDDGAANGQLEDAVGGARQEKEDDGVGN